MRKQFIILINLIVVLLLISCSSSNKTIFEGKILAYEQEDGIILVESNEGALHQFHLTEETEFVDGNKTALIAGQIIQVNYKDMDASNPPNSNAMKITFQ